MSVLPARRPSTPPSRAERPLPRAHVCYLGTAASVVRGPVSGFAYAFSPAQPVRNVDARDAQVMLRSRLFRNT